MDGQITMEEYNPEYAAFVEKFKPKKTTDDCYTPENIYNAVRDWVLAEYKISTGGGYGDHPPILARRGLPAHGIPGRLRGDRQPALLPAL